MLRKKSCVILVGLKQEMYFALGIADRAFADEGLECVVTAALDGSHNVGSLHPEGYAVDVRDENCTPEQHDRIFLKLQRLERYGYDVINELANMTAKTTARHFHIEYQPKEGEHFWRDDD